MTPAQTEKLAQEARQRVAYFINRMASQQLRRMREAWSKPA